MLTKNQVQQVCLFGCSGKQCRYLCQQQDKFFCLKKTSKKAIIDNEVEKFLDQVEEDFDLSLSDLPFGDNCQGYHFLK